MTEVILLQAWSSQGTVRGSAQQLFFGLLIDNIALISLLVLILIFFGLLWSWLLNIFGKCPTSHWVNFGPSVEFWVRLPRLKTQVHVVITLSTPRGKITKTPLTAWNVKCVNNFFFKKKDVKCEMTKCLVGFFTR